MPARVSEALVLRTYPLREADLIVSFLTRDQGKLRGVARRARRPKSAFGAGLERLSYVRMAYFQRETRELVNLDSSELIRSQFDLVSDYLTGLALDYFVEVSEQMLPAAEPNERFFRLLLAVVDELRRGAAEAAWRAITYFSLWAVRLSGWLPDLNLCLVCRNPFDTERGFFIRGRAGLLCSNCRQRAGVGSAWELSRESRGIAHEILHKPISQVSPHAWAPGTAADLRRFLLQQIEAHLERRLITAALWSGEREGAVITA